MQLLLRSLIGLAAFSILVFGPAGTVAYWQGWAFIAVFSISTTIIGVYLALKDPVLLERRMKAGPAAETRPRQKIIISLAFAIFLLLLVVSTLDHRFGWSRVPTPVSLLGDALVAIGLMIDLRVLRENSYGAATIERMEGQQVVTTGPYALVRHPMYAGALIMVFGVPLALGSWWGLIVALAAIPTLMLRVLDEEEMLRSELDGYGAYTQRVRYRLIPGLW